MNEGQVRAVLATARLGSMTCAAEELGVTQPAVKKQVDSIEDEWGVVLFERTAHGCTPTNAGVLFCEGMKPICLRVGRLREAVRDAGGVYLCRYQMERYRTLCQVPLDWDAPAEGFIHRKKTSYPVRLFLDAASRVLAGKVEG